MPQKIVCPECQGPLRVWLDIDASLYFNVSSTGKLSKRAIEDNLQGDGRCGLKCQKCDWQIHGDDAVDEAHLEVIKSADDEWQGLQLSVTRLKN